MKSLLIQVRQAKLGRTNSGRGAKGLCVKKGDDAGDWKVDLATDVVGGKAEVKAHVFDAEGRELHHSGLVFSSPKLWSAECPNLYTLVLELVASAALQTGLVRFVE